MPFFPLQFYFHDVHWNLHFISIYSLSVFISNEYFRAQYNMYCMCIWQCLAYFLWRNNLYMMNTICGHLMWLYFYRHSALVDLHMFVFVCVCVCYLAIHTFIFTSTILAAKVFFLKPQIHTSHSQLVVTLFLSTNLDVMIECYWIVFFSRIESTSVFVRRKERDTIFICKI